MEGVLSEQAHVDLEHEIDYDNTELDTGKVQGDDFDFDIGDGNIVQSNQLDTAPDNGTDPIDHTVVESNGEAYEVAQGDYQDNDAEVTNDFGEHEIDYDHDDIGESLAVPVANEEMGGALALENQDGKGNNEEYEELNYERGDDAEVTGQEGSNADDLQSGAQNFDDYRPGEEPDFQRTDLPSVDEAQIGEAAEGGAEGQGGVSPGHDATLAPQTDAFEGNDKADEAELDGDGGILLPENAEFHGALDDYDESAYSMEDGNVYDSQSFTASHPDVTFCYRHDEFSLFAESPDDDPNTYFLADTEYLNQSLCDFLTKIRGIIADEVSPQDEIVLRVDGLGLEFGETTTRDFLDRTTFGQIIELHDRLVKLDDAAASRNLYVYLITRPNCLNRFGELSSGVTNGKGLSNFERYFDAHSPAIDTSGDESHGVSQEDNAIENLINDSHFTAEENAGEDGDVDQLLEEAVVVGVEQLDPEPDSFEFAEGNVEEVVQVTHTEFYEGDGDPEASNTSGVVENQDTEIGDEFLQNLDDQQHEETFAESAMDSTWTAQPENGQAEENQVVHAIQEEELFDYDDNEEFDDQVEIQDANRDGEVAHDSQNHASSTLPQEHDDNSHAQHEIDFAAAEDYLETDAPAEVITDPSNLPDTEQDLLLNGAQSGTPLPVSDNTSASNTLNGEEIDFDDDVRALPAVTGTQNSFDTGVDEIDWDHDEDDILDEHETNPTLSSNSAKRSRQSDAEAGLDDENAVKRRRT